MRPFILLILTIIFIVFATCKKDVKKLPATMQTTSITPSKTDTSAAVPKTIPAPLVNPDTIPDGSMFKIQLVKDNINTDETMIIYRKAANPGYDPMEDGPYFRGAGQVSLASFSDDERDMAINTLPYAPGKALGLDVFTKSNGAFSLRTSYEKTIPTAVHFWLKDLYLKDSIDVRLAPYDFNVNKADTNTFGTRRFKLVVSR